MLQIFSRYNTISKIVAQPDQNMGTSRVNGAHDLNLLALLAIITLIDADRVNPQRRPFSDFIRTVLMLGKRTLPHGKVFVPCRCYCAVVIVLLVPERPNAK